MNRTYFLITAAVVGFICLLGWNSRSTTPLALAQNGACSVDMQFIIDSSLSMLGKFDNSAPANSYNPWETKTSAQQFIIEQVYSQLQTGNYEHDRRWFIHYRADPPSWYQIFDNSPPGQTIPEGYGNGPPFYQSGTITNAGAGKPLASAINIARDKLANPTLRAQEPNNKRIVVFINDAPGNMDVAGSLQSRLVYNTTNVAAIGLKNSNGNFKTAAEVRQLGQIDPVTGKRTGEPLADTMLAADQLFTYADKINSITLNDQGTNGLPETQPDLKSHPNADLTEYLAKAGNGSKAGVFSVANTYNDLRALTELIGTQRRELCGPDPSPTPSGTPGGGTFDPDWRLTLKKTIYEDFTNTGRPITLNNNMGPLATAIKGKVNNYPPASGLFYPNRAAVGTDDQCTSFIPGNLPLNRFLCLKSRVKLYLTDGTELTTHLFSNVEISQLPSTGPITIEGNVLGGSSIDGVSLETGSMFVGGQVLSQGSSTALPAYVQGTTLAWSEVEKLLGPLTERAKKKAKEPSETTTVARWNLNAVGNNPTGLQVTTFSLNVPGGSLWKTDDLVMSGPVEFDGRGTILAKNVTFKQGFSCRPGTVLTIIAEGSITIDGQPDGSTSCGALVAAKGNINFPNNLSGQALTMTGVFVASGNINLPTVAGNASLTIKLDKVFQLQPTNLGADVLRILNLTSPA